jgi:imidazolonepropionase-like amidohydrolase
VPAGTTQVDVKGRTLLPGFINAHGHVGGATSSRAEIERQLLLYGRYGVTSVFSLGGDGASSVIVRDEPAQGRARLFIAGPVVAGTTAAAAGAEVEKNAAMGVDWIKIRVDDNLGTTEKMPRDGWKAAIDRAHARGLPVAAHVFYLEDAKALVREGVELVAHSVRDQAVDAELIMLARENGVCVSPTLMREVSTYVYESTPAFFSDEFFLRHADASAIAQFSTPERQQQTRASASAQQYKAAFPQASRNVKQLADSGVTIAMGTDTGVAGRFQGYFEHLELEEMVRAGLTPMQAIVAATGDAARCMRKPGVIGTIQPGAFADLVVYAANPASDIRNTRSIESVWVAGQRLP